jgi:hypothetical protein
MHFEILIEDVSGKKTLMTLVPKILGEGHTFRLFHYKGIGHIPRNLHSAPDPRKFFLLDQLPRALRAYGKTYAHRNDAAVIVVCDLDDRNLNEFRRELVAILDDCRPRPLAWFCLAIEEGEAWLLGDLQAIKTVYPDACDEVLQSYENDSICGTWETLAEAVCEGGVEGLRSQGWYMVGRMKSVWAQAIPPHMDVENNASPSFRYFRKKLRELAGEN